MQQYKYNILTLFLCAFLIYGCRESMEKAVESSPKQAMEKEATVSLDTFQAYFETVTEWSEAFEIRHWRWGTADDSYFYGKKIENETLQAFVDTTFRIHSDEDYYALFYLRPMNAYVVRNRMSEANHMQQVFMLMYDEKNQFQGWKKVAAYFGAEGFLNRAASWLTVESDGITLTMRNTNWSQQPGQPAKNADEIQISRFTGTTFKEVSTNFTSSEDQKKYKILD